MQKCCPEKRKRKCLNSVQRKAAFLYLVDNYDTSTRLPPGAVTEAAERFKVSRSQVKTIWKKRKSHAGDPEGLLKALSPKKDRCTRKKESCLWRR